MWQMMETNISGGRLRMEGREVVGEVRDMIFCPRIKNQESVDGEFGLFPIIKGFKKKNKMTKRPSLLMLMKNISLLGLFLGPNLILKKKTHPDFS